MTDELKVITVDSNITSITTRDLIPGTNYKFTVSVNIRAFIGQRDEGYPFITYPPPLAILEEHTGTIYIFFKCCQ